MKTLSQLLSIKQTSHKLQSGSVLIAVPFSGDAYFDRTVILIVEHNEKGSFGIVLNKELNIFLHHIIEMAKERNLVLCNGGPVAMEELFFLSVFELEGSIPLSEDVFFGGREDLLANIMKHDLLNQQTIHFYLGYAGWQEGQLEEEIKNNMWVVGKLKKEFVFSKAEEIWAKAVSSLGKQYAHWLSFPEKEYYN